jgi:hypothetical protein
MTTPPPPVFLSAQVFLQTTMVRHSQQPSIIIPLTEVSRHPGIYCIMQIIFYSWHHQGIDPCPSLVAGLAPEIGSGISTLVLLSFSCFVSLRQGLILSLTLYVFFSEVTPAV